MEVRSSTVAFFTFSEMGLFCTTSWRAGAGVDLSRYFCVWIAARPSAYICGVIDTCCSSAVSFLTAAASILNYVGISVSDFSLNAYDS